MFIKKKLYFISKIHTKICILCSIFILALFSELQRFLSIYNIQKCHTDCIPLILLWILTKQGFFGKHDFEIVEKGRYSDMKKMVSMITTLFLCASTTLPVFAATPKYTISMPKIPTIRVEYFDLN